MNRTQFETGKKNAMILTNGLDQVLARIKEPALNRAEHEQLKMNCALINKFISEFQYPEQWEKQEDESKINEEKEI
jgi:hypothetical protein